MTESHQDRDTATSPYDPIAELYDPWSRSVVEDIDFYVERAVESGGPVVELGVGTGRIAIPIAQRGIEVVGVDGSAGMIEVCGARAEVAGVRHLLDLRLGDFRRPPVDGPVPLVLVPFRSYLHMTTEADRRAALTAVYRLLGPGGRFVFDVFAPAADDIEETNNRWIEREPGIFERADWNTPARTFTLHVRGAAGSTQMSLAWISAPEWRSLLIDTGFEVVAEYGWFDGSPYRGGEDVVFVATKSV